VVIFRRQDFVTVSDQVGERSKAPDLDLRSKVAGSMTATFQLMIEKKSTGHPLSG